LGGKVGNFSQNPHVIDLEKTAKSGRYAESGADTRTGERRRIYSTRAWENQAKKSKHETIQKSGGVDALDSLFIVFVVRT
jgi:hypothetical protein